MNVLYMKTMLPNQSPEPTAVGAVSSVMMNLALC
jgi:hypothetical protein